MLRNWIQKIAARLLPAPPTQNSSTPAVVKTAPQPASDVFQLAAPPPDSQRRGRPLSASMNKTLEVMKANPGISAAELAKKLSVSQSYARTLLRRAKSRCSEAASKPASSQQTRAARRIETTGPARQPAVLHVPCAPNEDGAVRVAVSELTSRLEQAEETIQMIRSTRSSSRGSWDLNRRSEVIRRSLAGEAPEAIASALEIPSGEVNFILKVHRVLTGAS